MLFSSLNTIASFNFIDGTSHEIYHPNRLLINSWKFVYNDYSIIRFNDLDDGKFKVYSFNYLDEFVEVDENTSHSVQKYGDYYITLTSDYEKKSTSYFLFNDKTKEIDTLIDNGVEIFGFDCYFENDKLWYQNFEGELVEYNLLTKEKIKYSDFKTELKRYNSINRFSNRLYIINSSYKDNHIQIYDLVEKKTVLDTKSKCPSNITGKNYLVRDNRLIIMSYNNVDVIDINSGSFKSYNSGLNRYNNLNIIDEKYMLNFIYGKFELIDIYSGDKRKIHSDFHIASGFKLNMVSLGDNYLISLEYQDKKRTSTLIRLDTNKMECYPESKFDKSNSGLKDLSKLINFNGEIILVEKYIYIVNGDSLTRLNSYPLEGDCAWVDRRYKIIDNKLYFQERIEKDIRIMMYDGENLSETLRIKQNNQSFNNITLLDFDILGNNIYFVTNLNQLFRYSLNTKQYVKIEEQIKTLKVDNNKTYLYKNGEFLLYLNGEFNELFKIDNQGNFGLVFKDNYVANISVVTIKDRVFAVLNDGLYEIKENSLSLVFKYKIINCCEDRIVNDAKRENILIPGTAKEATHFDGQLYNDVGDDFKISNNKELGNSIFLISKNHYYDCNRKITDSFEGLDEKDDIIDLIFTDRDTFLITITRERLINTLNIYILNDKLKNIELKTSFENVGDIINYNSKSFGNSALIYCGEYIFNLGSNNEFVKLENARGTICNNNLVFLNGFYYFIAIDKLKGRQLFRTNLGVTSIISPEAQKKEFTIYPNPVDKYINLKTMDVVGKNYSIIDIKGKEIRNGIINNSGLNVPGLIPGMYFLIINNGDNILISKFLKQ